MITRDALLAAIDPNLPRIDSPDELTDRILGRDPNPTLSGLAAATDQSMRPLLFGSELAALRHI